LSIVTASGAVYEGFLDDDVARSFLHSHSYTGNALACRAALAALDRFSKDRVLGAYPARAAELTDALSSPGGTMRPITEFTSQDYMTAPRGNSVRDNSR